MCDVAHTHLETGKVLLTPARLRLGNDRAMGGVMPRSNLWSESVPRVELDQRSREARLRFERIDRVFILRAGCGCCFIYSRSANTAGCRKSVELKNCSAIGGLPAYRCFSGSGWKMLESATYPSVFNSHIAAGDSPIEQFKRPRPSPLKPRSLRRSSPDQSVSRSWCPSLAPWQARRVSVP